MEEKKLEYSCRICGRPLKNPDSQEKHMGPFCFRRWIKLHDKLNEIKLLNPTDYDSGTL